MGVPEKITNEYLEKLPKIKINPTGDVTYPARYDQERNVVYLLDNDGNFTGKVAPADKLLKSSPAVIPQPQEPEDSASEQDPISEETAEAQEIDVQEPTEETPPKKKRLKPLLIIGAVFAVLLLLSVITDASGIVRKHMSDLENSSQQGEVNEEQSPEDPEAEDPQQEEPSGEPAPSEDPTQSPTETTEDTKEDEEEKITVSVLTAKEALLPGHLLVPKDFTIMEVEDFEYRLLAGISGIYTEDDQAALIGQVVTRYLPSGSYFTFDSIATSYSPSNPWSRTEEKQSLVYLAVNADPKNWCQYLWGVEAGIVIETQTKITTNNIGDVNVVESELPEGIKYSNSVVESMVMDTYELQNALIVDVLDEKGNSLFPQYYALTQIPSGYLRSELDSLYGTKAKVESLLPSTIVIALPASEAAVISALRADTITVTIQNPASEITTELQSQMFGKLQNVGKLLIDRWKTFPNSN